MLLMLALCAAGLSPGIATAWLVHHRGHGWPLAVLAGVGVTMSLPALLLTSLIVFPPLGYALGAATGLAAVNAYDDGRIWVGAGWTVAALVCLSCAGWAP